VELVILSAMAVVLAVLAVLIRVGGKTLHPTPTDQDEPGRWPRVALIVPVAGAAPGLAARLTSFLEQDYPDYQMVLVTRSLEDPATAVIRTLLPHYPRAKHVLSGPATACGQKNHNLLAGLKLADPAAQVLAFCDANQVAPANWLKEMVRPLAAGASQIVSGYHQILPQDLKAATLGRAATVLLLSLAKGLAPLNQPWGGSTAISRDLFASLKIDRLWGENVVDDVSLAARLKGAGLRVGYPAGAPLVTPLGGETGRSWEAWLTRQWLYLKFCLPGSWLAGGGVVLLLGGLVLLAAGRCLLAPWEAVSPGGSVAAAGFLTVLTGLGAALRRLHPHPGPLGGWLAAFYGAIFMAGWCHLRTWRADWLCWRDICYRVGLRGKVLEVKEGN
jgi:ceramide glucosyltransferase